MKTRPESISSHANEPENSADERVDNEGFTQWAIPDVTQAVPEDVSNLFGHQATEEVVEEQVEAFPPLTMSALEEIRLQAVEDGFEEGKTVGYQEGLEAGRLAGLEQGHSEGVAQGIEQGVEQGLADAKIMLDRLETVIEQFQAPLSLLDTEIEQSLVELTLTLAKAVICHEMKTTPEHVLAALRTGVDSLPLQKQQVNIRLHPEDCQLVERLYSKAQLDTNNWQLESDPSLNLGDCMISEQRSAVDMRLETRIDAVFEQLRAHNQQLQHEIQTQRQLDETPQSSSNSELDKTSVDESTSATPDLIEHSESTSDPQIVGEQDEHASKPTAK